MEQGVSEDCLQVAQDPTACYYEIPEQESFVEIIGIPTILLFIVLAIALAFLVKWAIKQKDKISCPHCGAKWYAWQSRNRGFGGFWVEYFCYNCQRYWT